MPPYIICVDGLVAAGKTSLLNAVSEAENINVLLEPISQFLHFEGHKPLEIMYRDMAKEASFAQHYINRVLTKHWQQHLSDCKEGEILLSERSLYSSVVFASNLKQMGYIKAFHYDFLSSEMQQSILSLGLGTFGADKIFFLDSPPEKCLKRISKRGRNAEQTGCELDYLTGLYAQMKKYLEQFIEARGADKVKVTQTRDLATLKRELLDFCRE